MTSLNRRTFLRYGAGISAFASSAIVLPRLVAAGDDDVESGDIGGGGGDADVNLTIQDVDFELIDGSTVFMYAFCETGKAPTIPGPIIRVREGRTVTVKITNLSTRPHGFQVPGQANSSLSSVPPSGGEATVTFTAGKPGTYFYLDPDMSPLNRLLGLHGAFVVEPENGRTSNNNRMPYSPADVPPGSPIDKLFGALGTTARFPGDDWDDSRDMVWIFNQIDPRWCQRAADGQVDASMLSSIWADFKPRYFTINGLCGIDAAHDKNTCPRGTIGEPLIIRCMNAGLACHSPHIHGNHVFMLTDTQRSTGAVTFNRNVIERDVWTMESGCIQDCLLPFTAPPDVPPNAWPPRQEKFPLSYPMHCHNEISQTSAGGSYPMGLMTDWEIDGLHS